MLRPPSLYDQRDERLTLNSDEQGHSQAARRKPNKKESSLSKVTPQQRSFIEDANDDNKSQHSNASRRNKIKESSLGKVKSSSINSGSQEKPFRIVEAVPFVNSPIQNELESPVEKRKRIKAPPVLSKGDQFDSPQYQNLVHKQETDPSSQLKKQFGNISEVKLFKDDDNRQNFSTRRKFEAPITSKPEIISKVQVSPFANLPMPLFIQPQITGDLSRVSISEDQPVISQENSRVQEVTRIHDTSNISSRRSIFDSARLTEQNNSLLGSIESSTRKSRSKLGDLLRESREKDKREVVTSKITQEPAVVSNPNIKISHDYKPSERSNAVVSNQKQTSVSNLERQIPIKADITQNRGESTLIDNLGRRDDAERENDKMQNRNIISLKPAARKPQIQQHQPTPDANLSVSMDTELNLSKSGVNTELKDTINFLLEPNPKRGIGVVSKLPADQAPPRMPSAAQLKLQEQLKANEQFLRISGLTASKLTPQTNNVPVNRAFEVPSYMTTQMPKQYQTVEENFKSNPQRNEDPFQAVQNRLIGNRQNKGNSNANERRQQFQTSKVYQIPKVHEAPKTHEAPKAYEAKKAYEEPKAYETDFKLNSAQGAIKSNDRERRQIQGDLPINQENQSLPTHFPSNIPLLSNGAKKREEVNFQPQKIKPKQPNYTQQQKPTLPTHNSYQFNRQKNDEPVYNPAPIIKKDANRGNIVTSQVQPTKQTLKNANLQSPLAWDEDDNRSQKSTTSSKKLNKKKQSSLQMKKSSKVVLVSNSGPRPDQESYYEPRSEEAPKEPSSSFHEDSRNGWFGESGRSSQEEIKFKTDSSFYQPSELSKMPSSKPPLSRKSASSTSKERKTTKQSSIPLKIQAQIKPSKPQQKMSLLQKALLEKDDDSNSQCSFDSEGSVNSNRSRRSGSGKKESSLGRSRTPSKNPSTAFQWGNSSQLSRNSNQVYDSSHGPLRGNNQQEANRINTDSRKSRSRTRKQQSDSEQQFSGQQSICTPHIDGSYRTYQELYSNDNQPYTNSDLLRDFMRPIQKVPFNPPSGQPMRRDDSPPKRIMNRTEKTGMNRRK